MRQVTRNAAEVEALREQHQWSLRILSDAVAKHRRGFTTNISFVRTFVLLTQ